MSHGHRPESEHRLVNEELFSLTQLFLHHNRLKFGSSTAPSYYHSRPRHQDPLLHLSQRLTPDLEGVLPFAPAGYYDLKLRHEDQKKLDTKRKFSFIVRKIKSKCVDNLTAILKFNQQMLIVKMWLFGSNI
ncbi:hypothetical protein XENORESO_019940 [Xenotaenia resolanae]|uniref:Uncharacterized protein n=1 Tax=Xenotaenia resolanae TaxID=208358 RepID=A0ABV0W5U3_9TELE